MLRSGNHYVHGQRLRDLYNLRRLLVRNSLHYFRSGPFETSKRCATLLGGTTGFLSCVDKVIGLGY
jgi:hypothetical protein